MRAQQNVLYASRGPSVKFKRMQFLGLASFFILAAFLVVLSCATKTKLTSVEMNYTAEEEEWAREQGYVLSSTGMGTAQVPLFKTGTVFSMRIAAVGILLFGITGVYTNLRRTKSCWIEVRDSEIVGIPFASFIWHRDVSQVRIGREEIMSVRELDSWNALSICTKGGSRVTLLPADLKACVAAITRMMG